MLWGKQHRVRWFLREGLVFLYAGILGVCGCGCCGERDGMDLCFFLGGILSGCGRVGLLLDLNIKM